MKFRVLSDLHVDYNDRYPLEIPENGRDVFTVLCGGREYSEEKSLAEQWAINNGAPIENIYEKDVDKLVDKITKSADYLVAQSGSYFSDWIIRKMKFIGKHGSVI